MGVHVNADTPVTQSTKRKGKQEEYYSLYLDKISRFKQHLHFSKSKQEKEDKLGYFSLLNKTISLMVDQMAKTAIEQNHPDILINISRDVCSTFDFYKAEELVRIGKEETKKALEDFL